MKRHYLYYAVKPGYLLLVALLFFSAVLGVCVVKEKAKARRLYVRLVELDKDLDVVNKALSRSDLQEVKISLAQIQRNVKEVLPSAPVPSPKGRSKRKGEPARKETVNAGPPPAPRRIVKGSVSADRIPDNLGSLPPGEHVLFCEKRTKTLYLFQCLSDKFTLVKTYPAIIGRNELDKTSSGDFATPEGTYFLLRFIPDRSLAEQYGWGAFPLSYPNFLDRRAGKTGGGIWLHGHNPNQKLEDIRSTKGCVVVDNESLMELSRIIRPGFTPIVIVNEMLLQNPAGQKASAEELRAFLNAWKQSWESLNTAKYLGFYAGEFMTSDGMDYRRFKTHKENVNRNKKFIKIKIDKAIMLTFHKNGADIAVIQFDQVYTSNNFNSTNRKTLYLKRDQAERWQIIGEV
ncbi:MAG: L,D-transpeptidase family protein [Candidatus Omnitrophota bacterium]